MIARVAIDLALDRLFDYEVPDALKEKLAVGQLLSVPFGHREARGFVVEVRREKEEVRRRAEEGRRKKEGGRSEKEASAYRLKPVNAIVDETPFFSPTLLELVKKIAAYTAAPIDSLLRAALPAPVLKRNARAKEQLFVEPSPTGESVDSEKSEIDGAQLTPRQRWLYENVVRLGGGWMQPLCQELGTTPASLRTLAEKGLVAIAPRAKRRDPLAGRRILPSKPLPLNQEQDAALKMIEGRETRNGGRGNLANPPKTILLHGVTGSGKTEVYLQAIARELEAGRGAIVMVPEISLTPQTVQRFASRFGDTVAVLHSAMSDGERYDEWHRIRSGAARVVIGPRSAVWAPVRNLGLIVVDEEHEPSYKQEDNPRYSARDVAVLRGAMEGATVVLGSATPSLESWVNARRGKYALAEMKNRAGSGRLPSVALVDMRGGAAERRSGAIFSQELLEAVRTRLERGEQTMLFLNRRGYSRSAVCAACGRVETCAECGIPYTYHRADSCLRCHVCGRWSPLPAKCPQCGASAFDFVGVGTQRAEAALAKCFPKERILRMDADSTSRKNTHDDILSAFRRGDADILLGTQMIAKGLDFPNVTLVGVLNADASLNMPDFRAAERTFQLLAQVSGRAGRAELPGEVLIQSYDPGVPTIRAAAAADFARFADDELKAREEAFLPPFCHLAVVDVRSRDLKAAGDWAVMYAESLKKLERKTGLLVSDAMPASLEKADGWYRWQIVLRSKSASAIVGAWRWISSVRPHPRHVRASIDMDAVNVV